MNYIRTLVSGRKKRFQDRKYNLDLSYITPRLLAMAFPGSGIETVYRNSIEEVSKFLQERHPNNFIVLNLSGKTYDSKKFDGKVLEYNWVDHHAPPLNLLFVICGKIHQYLKENDENVVVINCRAGKGRTGTIVCCYLLFSGRFNNPDDCFLYYSRKRFFRGEGVTQPSQRKYVIYFHQMLKEKFYFPYLRSIRAIILKTIAKNSNQGSLLPYFEFYLKNSDKISLTTKTGYLEQKSTPIINDTVRITDNSFSYFIAGDITIKIYNCGIMSSSKLGRISFNTGLLDIDQTELKFHLKEIDPDNLVKNKKVPRDYQIIVKFGKMCDCNNKEYPINLCKSCLEFFATNNELNDWKEIHQVLKSYIPVKENDEASMKRAKMLLFGPSNWDDVDEVLNSSDFNKNGFLMSNSEEEEEDRDSDEEEATSVNSDKEDQFNSSFEGECVIF